MKYEIVLETATGSVANFSVEANDQATAEKLAAQAYPGSTVQTVLARNLKKIKAWFGISAPDHAEIEVGANARILDPNYVFQTLLLKKGGSWLAGVGNRNLMIMGEAGAGKSSFFREICSRMGVNLHAISCSGETKFANLIGTRSMQNGNVVWIDGPLTKAVREDCVFLADELTRMNTGEQMKMVPILDRQGELTIEETGEKIPFGPNFRFAATGNSGFFGDESGAYAGEKHGSLAFKDRFTILKIKPLDEAQEHKMLIGAVPELASEEHADITKKMVAAARKIRESFIGNGGSLPITLSHRGLIRWGEAMVSYSGYAEVEKPMIEALEDAVLNGCSQDTHDAVIELVKEWI